MSIIEKKNRGILPIENPDNMCMARCVVIGLVNAFRPELLKEIYSNENVQKNLAIELLEKCKIPTDKKLYSLYDLHKIQKWLRPKNIRLAVFKYPFYQLIYRGRHSASKNICLLLNGEHFDLILSIGKMLKVFKISILFSKLKM